ncbi:MAG: outer membrane beta-barrel protein [Beijerinckiaceae bacterium]|nr:outer membrane beta-barrel protein [Beijerinckiaceae bacterium]
MTTGALRLWAASCIAAFTVTCADAADLAPVPPPPPPPPGPIFFVHVGALGVFPQVNASTTGGGFFNTVNPGGPLLTNIWNVAIRPQYTVGLELGYFVTPNISIALSSGVPPLAHVKATGVTVANALGTTLLGTVRYGPAILLLQYHFNQFGALQPYVGVGGAYVLNFGNISDGVLRNFSIDQNFAFVLQAGADFMLTPNWGVFVDAKKAFYNTDAQGFLLGLNIPIRTHVVVDPWIATAGITFKY